MAGTLTRSNASESACGLQACRVLWAGACRGPGGPTDSPLWQAAQAAPWRSRPGPGGHLCMTAISDQKSKWPRPARQLSRPSATQGGASQSARRRPSAAAAAGNCRYCHAGCRHHARQCQYRCVKLEPPLVWSGSGFGPPPVSTLRACQTGARGAGLRSRALHTAGRARDSGARPSL